MKMWISIKLCFSALVMTPLEDMHWFLDHLAMIMVQLYMTGTVMINSQL